MPEAMLLLQPMSRTASIPVYFVSAYHMPKVQLKLLQTSKLIQSTKVATLWLFLLHRVLAMYLVPPHCYATA